MIPFKTEQCDGDYPTPNFIVETEFLRLSTDTKENADRIEWALNLPTRIEQKHIQWFVWGALAEYDYYTNLGLSAVEFQRFLAETVNVVIGYVNGARALDGKCTDIQCTIALEAAKLFRGTRNG